MSFDPSPPTRPNPQAARTLGIFNIALGSLLVLYGLFNAVVTVAFPAFGELLSNVQTQQATQQEARKKAALESFEQKMKEAETEEQRALVRADRELFLLQGPALPSIPTTGMSLFDDPRVQSLSLAQTATMLVLNLGLIVSGVGLVLLRRWGRAMAIVASALKVPALIVFAVLFARIAAPAMAESWTGDVREFVRSEGPVGSNAEIEAELARYERDMARLFAMASVMSDALGLIYPVIVLIVLTRPGVRAALGRPPAPKGVETR